MQQKLLFETGGELPVFHSRRICGLQTYDIDDLGCTCLGDHECDCQDYEAGLVSNECPVHNWNPAPAMDCPVHGERSHGR